VSGVLGFGVDACKKEGLPSELWCRSLAHLMRVGLPICVLAKEVVEIASHLASGMVERRHPAAATRHVRKDNGLFLLDSTKTKIWHILPVQSGPTRF
jgi:hypothetical protein